MVTTIQLRPETKARLDDIKVPPAGDRRRGAEPPPGYGVRPRTARQ